MNDPIKLIPNRPDAEVAAEFKEEILKSCEPVLQTLEKVYKAGFQCNVQFGMSQFGKMQVMQLIISKNF